MRWLPSLSALCVASICFSASAVYGWGKDGHCMVGSVAAQILASEGRPLFESHRFDLCYYNNVPDLLWKAPATYETERHEHYFNLEPILARLKKDGQKLSDLPQQRSRIDSSKLELRWGRAPWRIQELYEHMGTLARGLKKKGKDHQSLQAQWLITAGVLGHYVADLAQPLHCTENYDGQLTDQKGLHRHFESFAVSQLLPDLESKALQKALAQWPKFSKSQKKKSVFQMSLELCKTSLDHVPTVLKLDREAGRENAAQFVRAAEGLLTGRVATGALYLAELWRRQADWTYDGQRFFMFSGEPAYIPPGKIPAKK